MTGGGQSRKDCAAQWREVDKVCLNFTSTLPAGVPAQTTPAQPPPDEVLNPTTPAQPLSDGVPVSTTPTQPLSDGVLHPTTPAQHPQMEF